MGSRDTLASFFVRLLVLPLGLLSLYAGHKSYLAINNLHSDKNRAEKAAEYSDKAWRELWHTRLTQTSGVATVALSLISCFAIILLNAAPDLLALTNVAAEVAAYFYISRFWKAKAQIPWIAKEYNEAIPKSNDLRRVLIALGIAWACTGAVGYLVN